VNGFFFIYNNYRRFKINADWLIFEAGAGRAMPLLPRGFFLKNVWHFKDIFREFEAFLKISILFEDIFREIEAFLN
jgi:hypothetical protein